MFDDLLVHVPAGAAKLRADQLAWQHRRDSACRREGEQYEGGSMQPEVESGCLLDRTQKRIVELAHGRLLGSGLAGSAHRGCLPGTRVRRRFEPDWSQPPRFSGVEKSRFHDQPRMCPPDGECPWHRKAYVVRGDSVTETAVMRDFACVTYRTTTGWLLRRDLCEPGGPPCDAKPFAPAAQ
jgi:hypothetical protein